MLVLAFFDYSSRSASAGVFRLDYSSRSAGVGLFRLTTLVDAGAVFFRSTTKMKINYLQPLSPASAPYTKK